MAPLNKFQLLQFNLNEIIKTLFACWYFSPDIFKLNLETFNSFRFNENKNFMYFFFCPP